MRVDYKADPHQDEGLDHLLRNPRACLFWEMSLGKTVVTLTYLNDMIYQYGEVTRALVIAPDKVANGAWPDEIDRYTHLTGMKYCVLEGTPKQRRALLASDAQVFLVTEGSLEWLLDLYIYQRVSKKSGEAYGEWLGALPFDCVVIDELSKFKKQNGVRYRKLRRALEKSNVPYRIGLTGTPAPNGYQDLWAQMYLIDDGARLGTTEETYIYTYFTTRGSGHIIYQYTLKVNAEKIIANLISDICSTKKTRDEIPLAPIHIHDVELTLPEFERELYDALELEYVLELSRVGQVDEALVTVKTAADLTNKLLQVSSGAIYEDRIAETDPHIWHTLHDIKAQAVRQILDAYPDENFILVYQFAHEKARIMEMFPHARTLPRGAKSRAVQKEWNDGKIRMLVGHPASFGHGLNLQFGGRAQIWWGPTWNLEHWLQTTRRTLRRGGLLDVWIFRLIVKGTRDASVRKRVNSKESDQDFLFQEIKELKQKYNAAIRAQQG
jgi:SNF2 family DNA or RNA helicase